MQSRVGGGGGGQSTPGVGTGAGIGIPALPPADDPPLGAPLEAAPPLAGADAASEAVAQPPDSANDWQVQPVVQSLSVAHVTGTAWQLLLDDGAQSQPLLGGGGTSLPLEPAEPAPAPAPGAPALVPPAQLQV